MRLIVEGCWTDPALDGWERGPARRACDTCGSPTRGIYYADVGDPVLWRIPLCADCKMSSAQQVLRLVPGELAARGGAA